MKQKTNRCALITYHSAYNYGSILQAYATQQALYGIGIEADIINYRMNEQKYFYERPLRFKYGIRPLINDITLLLVYQKKRKKQNYFETFICDKFSLTEECTEPEEVYSLWSRYNTIISGSDQIWNKESCELRKNNWHYMDPYLLKGYHGKKISYASSVNTMTEKELQYILPELSLFDALSFREKISVERIMKLLGKNVDYVLDPTFLLKKEEWISRLGIKKHENHEPYIFCYSLAGVRPVKSMLKAVKKLTKKRKCRAVVNTPFVYVPPFCHVIEYHPEHGPKEFLETLYNADFVITDSYHGTILSINFGKEFYLLKENSEADIRKVDILGQLGLLDRIADDVNKFSDLDLPPIDYNTVYNKLNLLRQHSLAYLEKNLGGTI